MLVATNIKVLRRKLHREILNWIFMKSRYKSLIANQSFIYCKIYIENEIRYNSIITA